MASEPQLELFFMRQETVINRPRCRSGALRGELVGNGGFRGRVQLLKGKLTRTSNRYSTINLIDRHRSNLSLPLRTIRERRARCFHSSGIDLYALHKSRLLYSMS